MFYLYWYPYCYFTVHFVLTQLPSWSDGLYSLLGVFLPYASCFSEFAIFRNLLPVAYFSRVLLGLSLGLFIFSVPYFGLACDHGNSFLCLEE